VTKDIEGRCRGGTAAIGNDRKATEQRPGGSSAAFGAAVGHRAASFRRTLAGLSLLAALGACGGPDLVDPAAGNPSHPANPEGEPAPPLAQSDTLTIEMGERDGNAAAKHDQKKQGADRGHETHQHGGDE
jgi:hypothetical protein